MKAAPNASGNNYATIGFVVQNAKGEDSAPNTLTVNVNAVNDKPVVDLSDTAATNKAVTFTETDGAHSASNKVAFTDAITNLSDVEGDNLNSLKISIPTDSIKAGDVLQFSTAVFGGDISMSSYNTSIISFSNPAGLVLQGSKTTSGSDTIISFNQLGSSFWASCCNI